MKEPSLATKNPGTNDEVLSISTSFQYHVEWLLYSGDSHNM
jgi:hypothetical protein